MIKLQISTLISKILLVTAFDYALLYNLDSAANLVNMFKAKINIPDKNQLLQTAAEKGNLNLVNALLQVGAQPTIELAIKAKDLGYLKIMHRLLFTTLAQNPELALQIYLLQRLYTQ